NRATRSGPRPLCDPWRLAMSTTNWAKLLLCLAPAVLSAADDEHNCTIRDAAAPSSSITYVLCEQGLLLVTGDEGGTWATRKSAVTQSLEALYFLNAKNGWAVGWSGTILHTADGGNTWKQVKAAAAMWSLSSIHFTDAQNGFISGFAGQLLRTKDG